MPNFAHVSLILAPDRSKLSKRHGATSVGQVMIIHKLGVIFAPKYGIKNPQSPAFILIIHQSFPFN